MAPTLTGEDKFAVMEMIHFHPLIWKTSASGTGLESSREARGNVCETNQRGLKRLIARGLNLAYREMSEQLPVRLTKQNSSSEMYSPMRRNTRKQQRYCFLVIRRTGE